MRGLKNVFDFYINSSIHVALSVYALSWISLIEFNLDYDSEVLYFIFFASIAGYNFVKYFGLAKFHYRTLAGRLKAIQVFSLFSLVALCYFFFTLELTTMIYVGIFGLTTFLYAIPIIPKFFLDEKKNLRSIGGLKVYVIALVWTGVTVFLPLINNNFDITDDVIVTAIQRFTLVIVLMLPFEIRDLTYDSLKLATIPQRIGVNQTIIFGTGLLVVFFLLNYLKDDITSKNLIADAMITVITFLFLLGSRKKQYSYYSSFWVEAIPIFWLGLVLLF